MTEPSQLEVNHLMKKILLMLTAATALLCGVATAQDISHMPLIPALVSTDRVQIGHPSDGHSDGHGVAYAATVTQIGDAIQGRFSSAGRVHGVPVGSGSGSVTLGSLGAQSKFAYDFKKDFGAVCDDSADDSAALVNALSTMQAASGGTLIVPGMCKIASAVTTFPNNSASIPMQAPIRITSPSGASSHGQWTTPQYQTYGFDFTATAGTSLANLITYGVGTLEIDHLVLKAGSANTGVLLKTTFTQLKVHDNTFIGKASGTSAVNDAIILGGVMWDSLNTHAYDNNFQGYGTVIKENFFDNIRRVAVFQAAANSIVVRDNTISLSCGYSTGGAFEVVGEGVTDHNSMGNVIKDNTIEVFNYKYAVKLTHASYTQIIGNGIWDASGVTTASVDFDTDATNNTLITGYTVIPLAVNLGLNTNNMTYTASGPNSSLTGSRNIAIGPSALGPATTGGDSVAVGASALAQNTSGHDNVALGSSAMQYNASGSVNVALGSFALSANVSGGYNVALGSYALNGNTSGGTNIGLGYYSLGANSTGTNNIGIGDHAGSANQIGTDNIGMGASAMFSNTTANFNVAIGSTALFSNQTMPDNVAIGYQSLYSTTSYDNTCVGYKCAFSNAGGFYNVGMGSGVLLLSTAGHDNTAIGTNALHLSTNTTGQNVAVGSQAGFNSTGANNIFLGFNAGGATTTGDNGFYVSNSTTYNLIKGRLDIGHIGQTGYVGPTPTQLPSGTALVTSGSNDHFGTFTLVTGATSGTLTFHTAYSNAPSCTVTSRTVSAMTAYSASTSAISVTGGPGLYDYVCWQINE
jgi:hypothetical protein